MTIRRTFDGGAGRPPEPPSEPAGKPEKPAQGSPTTRTIAGQPATQLRVSLSSLIRGLSTEDLVAEVERRGYTVLNTR